MGNIYQGNSGKTYCLETEKIAGGGEGGIYCIVGNDSQVAKIFKPDKRTSQREEKIRLMVREKLPEEALKQVTWPQDVIYNREGFIGYIMPKVKYTNSLMEVYNSGEFDLRFRLMVAINLCIAVDTIHKMGQVCGDLNPQNICVNLNKDDKENAFHVTLVDTDSYHFIADGKTYRCEVGLADYIAPELQRKISTGLDLKSVPLPSYTKETDLFALAVHIFYLLMNGCHPFACAKDNSFPGNYMEQQSSGVKQESMIAPQPVENIVNGFFPFAHGKYGITIPIYAPEFDFLPIQIRELFQRTFIDGYLNPGKRVSAKEWKNALLNSMKEIVQCQKNDEHFYFGHRSECAFCEIEENISQLLGGKQRRKKPIKVEEPQDSLSGIETSSGGGENNIGKIALGLAIVITLLIILLCGKQSDLGKEAYNILINKVEKGNIKFEENGIRINSPIYVSDISERDGRVYFNVDDAAVIINTARDGYILAEEMEDDFSLRKHPRQWLRSYYEKYYITDDIARAYGVVKLGDNYFLKYSRKGQEEEYISYLYTAYEKNFRYEINVVTYGDDVSEENLETVEEILASMTIENTPE